MNKVYVFYRGGLVKESASSSPIQIEFICGEEVKAEIRIHSEEEIVSHDWDYVEKLSTEGDVGLWP